METKDDDDQLIKCMKMRIDGVRVMGMPRKTWDVLMWENMKELGLMRQMALDKIIWMNALRW